MLLYKSSFIFLIWVMVVGLFETGGRRGKESKI